MSEWSTTPPATPGVYLWRRTWQWEPIYREIDARGLTFSHRFAQKVPATKAGGEWKI